MTIYMMHSRMIEITRPVGRLEAVAQASVRAGCAYAGAGGGGGGPCGGGQGGGQDHRRQAPVRWILVYGGVA
jgi:uncharacterized membrane protein